MTKINFFSILVISYLMLGISSTFAQPAPHLYWLHNELNLTDDQEKKLEDLRKNHQAKMMSYRDQIQKIAIDFKALGRKDNITVSEYNKMKDEMDAVREKMKSERDSHESEVLSVLNDEQKTTWLKIKINRPGRGQGFGHGYGRGYGRGPGMHGNGNWGAGKGMMFRGGDYNWGRGPRW